MKRRLEDKSSSGADKDDQIKQQLMTEAVISHEVKSSKIISKEKKGLFDIFCF
jgi:hypothetical protein